MVENIESNIGNMLKMAWNGVWWDVLLRGALAIVFGLLVFFVPGLTVAFFVLLFGAFAIADGLLLLYQAVTVKDGRWWVRLLQGIVAIASGIIVLIWPNIGALTLLYVIAFTMIITGILQMIAAIELRKAVKGEWLSFIAGILSVIVGVILIARPLEGAIALAQTIGIFAIAYGIVTCVLAFELRELPQDVAKPT